MLARDELITRWRSRRRIEHFLQVLELSKHSSRAVHDGNSAPKDLQGVKQTSHKERMGI
jgi:hypothetical protein